MECETVIFRGVIVATAPPGCNHFMDRIALSAREVTVLKLGL